MYVSVRGSVHVRGMYVYTVQETLFMCAKLAFIQHKLLELKQSSSGNDDGVW